MKISLLTGCNDKHYQLGLLSGLVPNPVEVDFIANDDMIDADIYKNVNYFNLREDQNPEASAKEKLLRILTYYFKLIKYAAKTDSKLFHIQWLNKFIYFDRTLLNIYYKMLGKKLIYTAHNIDERERDGNSNLIHRLSLKFMYKIMDHIIVHTEKMKSQLIEGFQISESKISVIPHGIHNAVYTSELTRAQARHEIELDNKDKVILFFGNIVPYKGLEYLVLALARLRKEFSDIKLIIAGRNSARLYWDKILEIIKENDLNEHMLIRTEFIPDEKIEVYFKVADLSVIPYRYIFQSGILMLSYNFGLPVIVTDVGSLREEVIEGKTGFVCNPDDPDDLAEKMTMYFHSNLYKNLESNRKLIREYANEKYSWEKIGEKTYSVYKSLLNHRMT